MKILFTDGSSTSARQSVICLGRNHEISILDPAALCQCRFSRYVRRWYRCPSFSSKPVEYLDFLLELIEKKGFEVLFPTHEQIYLLSRFQHLFGPKIAMAVPDFNALDRTMNKAHFARLLDEVKMPQPAFKIIRTEAELLECDQFPCWVKLDFSTAGQGVRFAQSSQDMARIAKSLQQAGLFGDSREIIVQQHEAGLKRGATGIFQQGELLAFHVSQSRSIGVGGSANAKITVHDPEMRDWMKSFGSRLGWHGAMCLEYVYREAEGSRFIFECNPRIGETVLAFESGINLCQAWVDVALGAGKENLFHGQEGTKTHLGFLTLTSMAIKGAKRRELIAELLRAYRREGDYKNSRDEITRWSEDWLSIVPFLGVTLLLLLNPRAAGWLVRKTVSNYSLTAEGAKTIRQMGTFPSIATCSS